MSARDLVVREWPRRRALCSRPPAKIRKSIRSLLPTRAVVLATGGAGQLYAITTNPREARGEGVAIAARAGAVIADAEFVQFHPDRDRYRPRPGAAGHRSAARRRRATDQRQRRTLHARGS